MNRNTKYYLANKEKCHAASAKWNREHKLKGEIANRKRQTAHPSLVNYNRMMARCYDPASPKYLRYGARGIKVYPPWQIFSVYEKEFGYTKPGLGYTVDRINNDKGYEPGNVQWLTGSQNSKKGQR